MVYFKITDGEATRKFKVNPGEVTYDQLKERIAALFPKALDDTKDLHLQYRDADGDVITISSDQEFQEALAELPENHVWKLHIHGPSCRKLGPKRESNTPSDFFFQHSHRPFGGLMSHPWFGSGFGHFPASPWFSSNPWSHFDRDFDKILADHSRELNALHNDDAAGPTAAAATVDSTGQDVSAPKSEGTASGGPGLKVKNFGSWEPKPFEGPFGTGRIIGPVGYYISWNSGSEDVSGSEDAPKKDKEDKEEGAADTGTEADTMEASAQQ